MDSLNLDTAPYSPSKRDGIHIVNRSGVGIPLEEARVVSKWIAKAFAQARKWRLSHDTYR
jgi:hypothetical protein